MTWQMCQQLSAQVGNRIYQNLRGSAGGLPRLSQGRCRHLRDANTSGWSASIAQNPPGRPSRPVWSSDPSILFLWLRGQAGSDAAEDRVKFLPANLQLKDIGSIALILRHL